MICSTVNWVVFMRSSGEDPNMLTCPVNRAHHRDDAIGLLIYAATGHMAVQLLRAHRPLFAAGDPYRGTPEEIKAAFEGYIAYFGSYEVNEAEGVVTHHVHGASFPNWIGGDQQRFFAFAGNQLILSTPPILAGTSTMTGVLIWERVG